MANGVDEWEKTLEWIIGKTKMRCPEVLNLNQLGKKIDKAVPSLCFEVEQC
jgi:hypothetical protein